MGMLELEISFDDDLNAKIHNLALRYFGDDTDASLGQVLELAFRMRVLWSGSIIKGQEETDETISQWQFPESAVTGEDSDKISRWLFRR